MKFMKKHSGHIGRDPEYGAIFMSNSSTRRECLKRGLFGLPHKQADFVKQIKHGMVLFLFDHETRELHGVFRACSDGAMNIVPAAFCSSGMQFPAQVKSIRIWHCSPLPENEFRDAIKENYFSRYKFNFGLSEVQVQRLLTLFSGKKIDRSSSMRTAVRLSKGKQASEFSKAIGDLRVKKNSAMELGGGDIDFRDALSGDCFANRRNPVKDFRLTALCGSEGEPDIGQEYDTPTGSEHPGDASVEFRRLAGHIVPGAKDLLGNEFGMGRNFGRDATIHSPFSLDSNTRVAEYHDKGEFTGIVSTRYPSLWSNLGQSAGHGRVSIEADPQALAPRRVCLEQSYVTNRETYDLTYPRFLGEAARESSLPYDPDSPSFSTMDSSLCGTNPHPVSGYMIDTRPPEKVQPFSIVHSGESKYTAADFDLGDYMPLPSTRPDYPTSTSMIGMQRFLGERSEATKLATADFVSGDNYHPLPSMLPDYPASSSMIGVTDSEAVTANPSQKKFRRGLSHHLPRPGFLTSVESAEKLKNFESSSYSSIPSFYNSSPHHLPSGDGVDLPIKDRVNASRGDFRVPDFNNKAGQAQSTRRSVFSRLSLPPKGCNTKMGISGVDESVDEVMGFLHECHEHWMNQKELGSRTRNAVAGGDFEMKKQKTPSAEILEDGSTSLSSETAPNDELACEETMQQQPVQKPTFINFKRRSERQKSRDNLTQGRKEKPEDPSPRLKKRKLVRPKLVEEDPLAKKGGKVENVSENKIDAIEGTESKKLSNENGNADGNNEETLKREE